MKWGPLFFTQSNHPGQAKTRPSLELTSLSAEPNQSSRVGEILSWQLRWKAIEHTQPWPLASTCVHTHRHHNKTQRLGEVTQKWRALAFSKGLFPRTHRTVPFFRGSNALFWHWRVLHACGAGKILMDMNNQTLLGAREMAQELRAHTLLL